MRVSVRRLSSSVSEFSQAPLLRASSILGYAHDSARSFLNSFDTVRKARNAGPGTTTDEEQDLLRAMLVLAAAGLDSVLKQLIRDSLPILVAKDAKVEEGLENFVQGQLRSDPERADQKSSQRFLARILVAESHRERIIQEYVNELAGGSLQSPEEVMKTVFALGLEPAALGIDRGQLRPIFESRNRIIHELDIDFDTPNRNRRPRSRKSMVDSSNELLRIGEAIVLSVAAKLDA
jgi:hypothetical protein